MHTHTSRWQKQVNPYIAQHKSRIGNLDTQNFAFVSPSTLGNLIRCTPICASSLTTHLADLNTEGAETLCTSPITT
ncbi:hypothetical protein DPMN_175683 [Dreissena polymorpha]|uniref:Uncharacterized protein n=1 Tax=Dreissena polymorpha TaxID=45954 RepID=A0A9D4IIH0_DREPO|nr:hypothetical protein DPMN_175683 [Dreissena polymorpha]